jgi:hypothetical protein
MATTATGTTGTAGSALGTTGGTSMAGLADWAAPYITNYLGQAQALGNAPYQTYQGPLTAGESGLQTQAFQGIGGLTVPNQGQYNPVGSTFDNTQAQAYMNPYLQQALDPQMKELQRQADIARLDDAGRLTKAGAFGGSRQAIMESEGRRNLLDKQSNVLGQGYATAYDKAMQQFNADQQRKVQEAQFGADFGLKGLGAERDILSQQLGAGAVQRGITSEGIAADLGEFNAQREFPYKQVQFQRDMISGLPTGSVTNTPAQLSGVAQLLSSVGGIDQLLKQTGQKDLGTLLKGLGLNFGSSSGVDLP